MQKLLSFPISSHRFYNNSLLVKNIENLKTTDQNFSNLLNLVKSNDKIKLLFLTMINNFPDLLSNPIYQKRIGDEFAVFLNHKDGYLLDYLLVFEDIAHFFESKNEIANIGRGASASSLVNYMLGITKIDPIEYGLLFERWLDTDRVIDIDFDCFDKKEVMNYLKNKYGVFLKPVKVKVYWKIKPALKEVLKDFKLSRQQAFLDVVSEYEPLRKKLSLDDSTYSEIKFFNLICECHYEFGSFFNANEEYKDKILSLLDSPKEEIESAVGFIISDTENTLLSDIEKNRIAKFDILGNSKYKQVNEKYKLSDLKDFKVDEKNIESMVNNIEENDEPAFSKFLKKNKIPLNSIMDIAILEGISRPYYVFMSDNMHFKTNDDVILSILKETRGQLLFQEQLMEIMQKVFFLTREGSCQLMRELVKNSPSGLNKITELHEKFPHYKEELFQLQLLSRFLLVKAHAISYSFTNYLQWS